MIFFLDTYVQAADMMKVVMKTPQGETSALESETRFKKSRHLRNKKRISSSDEECSRPKRVSTKRKKHSQNNLLSSSSDEEDITKKVRKNTPFPKNTFTVVADVHYSENSKYFVSIF